MEVKKVNKERDYRTGKDTIARNDLESWDNFKTDNIYIKTDETFNRYKDLYLLNQTDHGAIIVISPPGVAATPGKIATMQPGPEKAKMLAQHNASIARRDSIFKLISESPNTKSYDEVEVSEEWLADYKKEASHS